MGQVIRDDSNILGVCLSPFQYVCEKFDVNCANLFEINLQRHTARDRLFELCRGRIPGQYLWNGLEENRTAEGIGSQGAGRAQLKRLFKVCKGFV